MTSPGSIWELSSTAVSQYFLRCSSLATGVCFPLLANLPSVSSSFPRVPIHHLPVDKESKDALSLEYRPTRDPLLVPPRPWRILSSFPSGSRGPIEGPVRGSLGNTGLPLSRAHPKQARPLPVWRWPWQTHALTFARAHSQQKAPAIRQLFWRAYYSPLAGLTLQQTEADKGLDKWGLAHGKPHWQGTRGTGWLHLLPAVVCASVSQKCIWSLSPTRHVMIGQIQEQRNLKCPLNLTSHSYL